MVNALVAAQFEKKNTATGISSIAALSLGFSMSMSGASHILGDADAGDDNSNFHKAATSPAARLCSLLTNNDVSKSSPKHSQRTFFANMKKKSTLSSTLSSYRRSSECSSMQTSFELQSDYPNGGGGRKSLDIYLPPDERSESFSEGCCYTPPRYTQQRHVMPNAQHAVTDTHNRDEASTHNDAPDVSDVGSHVDERKPLLVGDSYDEDCVDASCQHRTECEKPPAYSEIVDRCAKPALQLPATHEQHHDNAPADTPATPACANKRFLFANRSYPTIGKRRKAPQQQPARFSESDTDKPNKRKTAAATAARSSTLKNAQLNRRFNDCSVSVTSSAASSDVGKVVDDVRRKCDSLESVLHDKQTERKAKVRHKHSDSDPLLDVTLTSVDNDGLLLDNDVCQSIASLNSCSDDAALVQDSETLAQARSHSQTHAHDTSSRAQPFLETSLDDEADTTHSGVAASPTENDDNACISPKAHITYIRQAHDYSFV